MIVRTFDELANVIEQANEDLNELLLEAMNLAIQDTFNKAIEMSSGDVSRSDLRKLDNPYAKRHGFPLLDASIINEQTGFLKSNWRMEIVSSLKSLKVDGAVINDTWYIDYLVQGTKTMFSRPIDKVLEQYMEQRIIFHVRQALELFRHEYN